MINLTARRIQELLDEDQAEQALDEAFQQLRQNPAEDPDDLACQLLRATKEAMKLSVAQKGSQSRHTQELMQIVGWFNDEENMPGFPRPVEPAHLQCAECAAPNNLKADACAFCDADIGSAEGE